MILNRERLIWVLKCQRKSLKENSAHAGESAGTEGNFHAGV